MKNRWEADPKKYEEMAKPFESEEQAEQVAIEFLNAVRKLREQYRIAELIIQYQVYVQKDNSTYILRGGGGWGHQLYQAQLAKRAADQEFDHLARVIETISAAIPKARKELITDPRIESEAAEGASAEAPAPTVD